MFFDDQLEVLDRHFTQFKLNDCTILVISICTNVAFSISPSYFGNEKGTKPSWEQPLHEVCNWHESSTNDIIILDCNDFCFHTML